ncbi:MAG TPA: helix-turn-helix domain-containing protein [Ktedonobacterales bacterium]|nr:helix-turn-helix domain-containing protein [Ktedonobacterales bacterium]
MTASGPVTARELLDLLRRWQVRVVAGERGLERTVSWVTTMRARLPAFESFQGGELALIPLPVLRALRAQLGALLLPEMVQQLGDQGVAAILLGGLVEGQALPPDETRGLEEACALAEALALPLLAVPGTYLGEVEHELIVQLMARREPAPHGPMAPPVLEAAGLRESLRGEALDALLTGTYGSEAAMRTRAAQLGYDLDQPHAVVLVNLAPHTTPISAALGTHEIDPRARRLAEELTAALGAWARAHGAQVEALLGLGRFERGGGEAAERVGALVERVIGPRSGNQQGMRGRGAGEAAAADEIWAAGLGEPATAPAQVHRSAGEAHDAARLGLLVLGPRHVARAVDLGVYRLLLGLRDTGTLAPFVERTLRPLLADQRTGDALVETLEAFFAANGNLSKAARRLHLHRNSLLYRLHRARELLGQDLDDAELRLTLQLAIKGRRVLELS